MIIDFELSLLIAIPVALALDVWIGEPNPHWHPVVWMGNYLQRAGVWLQQHAAAEGADWPSFFRGAAAWWLGAIAVCLVAGVLQWALWHLYWAWAGLVMGVLLKPLFAYGMLAREVQAVEVALQQSLPAGQQQLARIVSRDVTVLDGTQVRESAIESLAENLNDSVVAAWFWFAILGLPGAALWRYTDTADSMWGYRGTYKGKRWEWAGKWAARVDDVLAWVPARLTGVCLALAAWPRRVAMGTLRQEAGQTPSPNSGWPMAAMALALQLVLRKPGIYTLNAAGAQAQPQHVLQAVRMSQRALVWALVAVASWLGLIVAGSRL